MRELAAELPERDVAGLWRVDLASMAEQAVQVGLVSGVEVELQIIRRDIDGAENAHTLAGTHDQGKAVDTGTFNAGGVAIRRAEKSPGLRDECGALLAFNLRFRRLGQTAYL